MNWVAFLIVISIGLSMYSTTYKYYRIWDCGVIRGGSMKYLYIGPVHPYYESTILCFKLGKFYDIQISKTLLRRVKVWQTRGHDHVKKGSAVKYRNWEEFNNNWRKPE